MAEGDYADDGARGAYADAFDLLGQQVKIRTSTGWNDGLVGKLVGVQRSPTIIVRDGDGKMHHIAVSILDAIAARYGVSSWASRS